VSNFRSTIRKTEKFKDMQQALDHFRVLKEEDPYFFYKFKLDDENRVQNLFWVDSASRHAYIESYHDFVSLDATYMTNMYDMICKDLPNDLHYCALTLPQYCLSN
jgi:hypothetical protein